MSFSRKSPSEWLEADVIAARPELEQRLIAQILCAENPPTLLELSAGADFLREGFLATSVYLVLDGELAVTVDGSPVAHLGVGAVFGELAIVSDRQRKATVTAVLPTTIGSVSEYVVNRDDLKALAVTRAIESS